MEKLNYVNAQQKTLLKGETSDGRNKKDVERRNKNNKIVAMFP
jgi:hypothetical protein